VSCIDELQCAEVGVLVAVRRSSSWCIVQICVLQCVAVCIAGRCIVCCSMLQRGAVRCSALQCDAVCCSVLQCVAEGVVVAVRRSSSYCVLQCVLQ